MYCDYIKFACTQPDSLIKEVIVHSRLYETTSIALNRLRKKNFGAFLKNW